MSDWDDDDDETPVDKPIRRARCPHCGASREVMPSGLFEIHVVVGRWSRSMCRGSGTPAKFVK